MFEAFFCQLVLITFSIFEHLDFVSRFYFVFVCTRRSVSHISHECAGRCLPQSISCHEKESRRIDVNISDELLFVFVLHYVFVFSGRDVGCISHGGGGRSRLPWVGVEWNRGSTSVGTSTCRQQQWLLPFFTKNILTWLSMTFFLLENVIFAENHTD